MEFELLKDIVIIFALSIPINLILSKFDIPSVVGYLLTGILAGPSLMSVISSKHEIEILAEIGVVLLLFTIGMEFSLKHLLKIRKIVFLGGLLQVATTGLVFYLLSYFWGVETKTAVFIGFLTSLSSSALVLKLLQERSELSSNYGRTTLGILIFQDIMLVPLLLIVNLMGDNGLDITQELIWLAVKSVFIIAFVYIGSRWLVPKILHLIAITKSQELFVMGMFLICLAIALLTHELGMSLAFGAFLAGLMISGSHFSHNAFSNLIPFKDTFTSFFFVSIGMLLDLNFVFENFWLVAASVLSVVFIKTIIAGATGFVLGHSFRGTVLVGLALCQVGEFSFILAKIGVKNSILDNVFYQTFLAVAVISMALTPLFMRYSSALANLLLKLPLPKFWVEGLFPLTEVEIPNYTNHMVIIGKDRTALKLSRMASLHKMKHVSIIFDPEKATEQMNCGELVVYGDAVNMPILEKAHVETAGIVIVSVGALIPSMSIIEKIKQLNPETYVIVRTKLISDMEELYKLGADQVFPEKLEIALDLFNRILIKKEFADSKITKVINKMRKLHVGEYNELDLINKPNPFDELPNINITAIEVDEDSFANGRSLVDLELEVENKISLLAVRREGKIIEHPNHDFVFEIGDVAFVLANTDLSNKIYCKLSSEVEC